MRFTSPKSAPIRVIFRPDRAPITRSKLPSKSARFRPPGDWLDQELGLYYLKSRYYDPEVCRFINADAFVSTGQGIIGYNMFAYCNNNPVNNKDPDGCWLLGAIVGGVLGGASALMNGGSFGDVVLATVEGAAVGALCEEGGWLLFIGAAVHGTYTAIKTEGDISTKVYKGLLAAGTTLFCSAMGGGLLSEPEKYGGYTFGEKLILNSVYGVASSGFDYVIQQSEVPSQYTDWWNNTFNSSSGNTTTGTSRNGSARDPGFYVIYRQPEIISI